MKKKTIETKNTILTVGKGESHLHSELSRTEETCIVIDFIFLGGVRFFIVGKINRSGDDANLVVIIDSGFFVDANVDDERHCVIFDAVWSGHFQ